MDTHSLEFWGTQQAWLLAGLLVVAQVGLAGLGAWHVRYRRWRPAGRAFAALAGPVVLMLTLLGEMLLDRRQGRGRQTPSRLAAIAAAGGMAIALAALGAVTGWQASAIWLTVTTSQLLLLVALLYNDALPKTLGSHKTVSLISLRSLAILALLAVLFKPVWQTIAAPTEARPVVAVVLDASASMTTTDEAPPSRYAEALGLLASQRDRLESLFDVRWYVFHDVATAYDHFDAIPPQADATAMTTNLAAGLRGPGSIPPADLAGVLLISDGRHNAEASWQNALARLRTTVFVAGTGAIEEAAPQPANVELITTNAPLEVPAGETITFDVDLAVTGLANSTLELELLDVTTDTPTPLAQATLWIDSDTEQPQVSFTCTVEDVPSEAGTVRHFRILATPLPGETCPDDNALEIYIIPTHDRLRVLYIEGVLRPEFKWLSRLLRNDSHLEVITLVRIDDEQFWSRGQVEGQPLLALPTSAQEFAAFDVILLGDLDADYWSAEQLAMLEAFVDDGGGLMMLGGHNAMGPGGYDATPLGDAMPVDLGPRTIGQVEAPFDLQLTAAGQAHPIFAGLAGQFITPNPLPELTGCVATGPAKPGAEVLAIHPVAMLSHGPAIALAVQPYGAGRTAVFAADTTWRWQLGALEGDADVYSPFWLQTIRYLGGDDRRQKDQPPALAGAMERHHIAAGESVRLRALALGMPDAVDTPARLEATLTPRDPSQAPYRVMLTSTEGTYHEATLTPPAPANGNAQAIYDVTIHMLTDERTLAACGPMTLLVAQPPAELEALARDEPILQAIARDSGGHYADLPAMVELIDLLALSHRPSQAATPRIEATSLHSFPLCFVFFAAALTAEWTLRRRWQLQ